MWENRPAVAYEWQRFGRFSTPAVTVQPEAAVASRRDSEVASSGRKNSRNIALRAITPAAARGVQPQTVPLESPYSKRIRRHLHRAGVELRWFNRFRSVLPSRLNHRDHRKLLMVDGRRAYVGSTNIMRGNSWRLCGDGCARQLDVRIEGSLAERMAESGTALWDGRGAKEPAWQPVAEGDSQLVASSAFSPDRPLRTLYRAILEQARTSAYLAMGYFVPDEDMLLVLERAVQRGVDVRLILPRHTDMPPTRWAAHALYTRLLAAGVRIYEYMPSIFHVKLAVVDSAWAVLGSGNLDYRSFYLNYELNLETRDTAFCQELQRVFLGDLELCEEITAEAWSRRPWQNRMKEKLVWPARGHL